MGRKEKLRSDPALALPHEVGAQIAVLQTLTHDQYGAVGYLWPRLWSFHVEQYALSLNKLTKLQERLLDLPVGANAIRLVSDMDYIAVVYDTGSHMALNGILALQHLCDEIERTIKQYPKGTALVDRLRETLSAASMDSPSHRVDYWSFAELEKIRDAIEHPKEANVYRGDQSGWDNVPLAWFLSDRSIKTGVSFQGFLNALIVEWEDRFRDFQQSVNLTVQRGVRSDLPHKKQRLPLESSDSPDASGVVRPAV